MKTSQLIASAIRILSIDAVAQANSGHPGMPLGMADIAAVLWTHFLKFNPKNPHWFNRDRFILSNGHGAMLHYALLNLFGYKLSLEDIKNFRQLHSKTPGHPERNHTPGIEVTTGPLSQGLANAVGMALAEKKLNQQFPQLIDHHTYVFLGDGCLMEGLSHESCSFAGEFQLNKLIAFYDCNGITIDGPTPPQIKDETIQRFKGYQWHILEIDGHDHDAIYQAIATCQQQDRPSLIICNTIIGLGSKLQGQAKVHGSPLDADDIANIKAQLNWDAPPFTIPEYIYASIDSHKGEILENQWLKTCYQLSTKNPEIYNEFMRRANGDLPDAWPAFKNSLYQIALNMKQPIATRVASQNCLEFLTEKLPELLGGSADLTPSNNTKTKQGDYLHYGVREFGMSAIMNGLAAHQGFIPYGGTFLVFSDYARNAIRMSAMMGLKVIYVLTHDSIGLGEDGPTHQPIEHLAMLRATPRLKVWRPASPLEMAVAWTDAIEYQGASCLILSRQNLDALQQTEKDVAEIQKGGYILYESNATPEIILMSTGSEIAITLEAAKQLELTGISARVISMPCIELFLQQSKEYQNMVLPSHIRTRVAVEAANPSPWYRFVGLDGVVIGLEDFGASAPAEQVREQMGITKNHILKVCHQLTTHKTNLTINE